MYKFVPLCHFIRKILRKSARNTLGDLTTTICIKKQPPFSYRLYDQFMRKEAVRFLNQGYSLILRVAPIL